MVVKDIDKGFRGFDKFLKELSKKSLKAGIFSDAGVNPETGGYIADYAQLNEFGTSKIPARPFLRTTADEQEAKWQSQMDKIVTLAISNQEQDVDVLLGRVGELVVNDIKEKISSNMPPPNAEATKARKKSSQTLIDTGAMRASVTYKIEN